MLFDGIPILNSSNKENAITTIVIRPEVPADHSAIRALTDAAFPNSSVEGAIVDDLRAAAALTLSLVAVDASSPTPNNLIGHVAFSPMKITPSPGKLWLGLGPISVAPDRQRQGIGRRLIEEGLAMLKQLQGVQGCVLLGDPKFYNRFGFVAEQGLRLEGVPAEYFMSRVLDGGVCPVGEIKYHQAFDQSFTGADSKMH